MHRDAEHEAAHAGHRVMLGGTHVVMRVVGLRSNTSSMRAAAMCTGLWQWNSQFPARSGDHDHLECVEAPAPPR